jgi:prepilin signal peptidase PulO-like enzyme (type II secretory pathway)
LEGILVVAGFFAVQYFISRGRWIGFGDVKFGLLLGSLLGLKMSLIFLMISYFLGGIVGLALVVLRRKKFSSQLPFGVFLSASAILMLLWGSQLSNWYLKLIGL